MADENVRVIKTIIVLRSDEEANFEANSSLMLRQGEVAITISKDLTKPSRLKVGDGVHTWGELKYLDSFSNGTGEGGSGSGVEFTPDGKALKLTSDNVLTLIGLDTATPGQSFRISEDGTSIEWFESATKADTVANKTIIDQINESLTNNYYTKEETDGLVAKVFKFKGTKSSFADLEAITDPKVGDVWTVKEAGKEANLYVYTEDEDGNGYWEDFPLTIDLTDYVLSTDFDALKDRVTDVEDNVTTLEGKVTTLEGSYTTLDSMVQSLDTDVSDLKTRVTALENNSGSGGSDEDLTELTEKVNNLDEYIEVVKPTINSLPDTIFSAMEVQTLENGNLRFVGTHINKDTDGVYNIGGESILATIKAVVPNGNPGLMTGADKAKLDKIFEVVDQGGEPNVIDTIKVGGEDLVVNEVDKSVNIPIGGEKLGVVKNYEGTDEDKPINVVAIDDDGVMTVPEVHIESLVADEDLIISGGDATTIGGGGAGAGA